MNPTLKKHLISATNTFLTAFLIAIASGLDVTHLDKATLISLGAVGLRAGLKALEQLFSR